MEAMHYLYNSCFCVVAVLSSLSIALDPSDPMIVRESNLSMNGSELFLGTVQTAESDIYVGVVQAIAPYKDYGNYNYDEMRKNEPIAPLLQDLSSKLQVLQRTGQCNVYDSARNFMDIFMEYTVNNNNSRKSGVLRWKGVFLSDCEEACQIIGRLGSNIFHEGLPVMSHGCDSPEFSDPVQYRTFARVGGMFSFLADPMVHLFAHFKVSRVVIVSSLDMAMETTRVAFSETFKEFQINTYEIQLDTAKLPRYDDSNQTMVMFTEAAQFIHDNARCS